MRAELQLPGVVEGADLRVTTSMSLTILSNVDRQHLSGEERWNGDSPDVESVESFESSLTEIDVVDTRRTSSAEVYDANDDRLGGSSCHHNHH